VADSTSGDRADTHASGVRTFLIADVRGYTRYSDERGDEAASVLTRRFAEIVHEAVPSSGGEVVELRGDEALCVFGSARDATWAAVELQRRFRERVNGEPAFPLPVGIGMDAGEAVPTDGGYRGRALNVAARLCSLAGPGVILASETVALLAGRYDRAMYAPRRPTRVKGVAEPVRYVEVLPGIDLPPPPLPAPARRVTRRKAALAAVGALVLIGAAVAAILLVGRDGSEAVVVPANSVALIDPAGDRIVEAIPVGDNPGPIDVGAGGLWVLNRDSRTVTKIELRTREVVDTIGLGGAPFGMSAGANELWVADTCGNTLLRIYPQQQGTIPNQRVRLPTALVGETEGYYRYCAVNADAGSIWASNDLPAALVRVDIDPVSNTPEVARVVRFPGHIVQGFEERLGGPSAIAANEEAVWAVDYGDDLVRRIDPGTGEIVKVIDAGEGPIAVAAGDGSVWVANLDEDSVSRVDAQSNSVRKTISVGDDPIAVALGEGAVWVANSGDGTVSRIDPETNEVVATIPVGNRPQGIIVADGLVWVTARRR
jgi:YVTN family beta-propeller protein